MAEFMTIDIRGDKELARMFRKAPEAFSPRVLMTGMMAGALPAANDIKALAPYLTGTYRRSIHIEELIELLAVMIGTSLPYGPRLEYGFVGVDSLGRRYNQPAQPHFRTGLNQNREQIRENVRQAVVQQLRKVVR